MDGVPQAPFLVVMLTRVIDHATQSLLFGGEPVDRDIAARGHVSAEDLRMLVRRGRLRQVVRGVYLDAGADLDLALRARCLQLRLPPGAAIARLSAAWLMGVDGRSPAERAQVLDVECCIPRGRVPVRRPGVRCYAAPLPEDDIQELAGLRCTTPTRTAIDLMRWRAPHMGLAVADALAARGLVGINELISGVERFRGAKGAAQARYLAALVEPLSESFGESWTRLRVADAGFPRPEAQVVVELDHRVARLDLAWRRFMVALEYDGEEFHSSAERRAHDERRRREVERRGWTLLVADKGDVLGTSLLLERAVGGALDGMGARAGGLDRM